MYNIVMGGQHPSTICVEKSRAYSSLKNLKEVVKTGFMKDALMEFIGEFARTQEIMPDDKTVGFVILNSDKQVLSISVSQNDAELIKALKTISAEYREMGFTVDLDMPD